MIGLNPPRRKKADPRERIGLIKPETTLGRLRIVGDVGRHKGREGDRSLDENTFFGSVGKHQIAGDGRHLDRPDDIVDFRLGHSPCRALDDDGGHFLRACRNTLKVHVGRVAAGTIGRGAGKADQRHERSR